MTRPSFMPDVPIKNIVWGLELPLLVLNATALVTAVLAWYKPGAGAMTAMSVGVCLLVAGLGARKAASAGGALPGHYVLARLTLVYAVFGVHTPGGDETFNIVPAALVAACLLAEPVAKAFAAQAFPYAAHFPGIRTRTARLPSDVIFWTNLAATAVITALGRRLVGLELVVGMVAALVNVVCLLDMAVFAVQRLRFNARLPRIWEDMKPVFAVHWQAAPGSIHQLTMWMEYLVALDRPFFLVTRTRENFREVTERFDVPVLHRVGLDAVEDALSPSLKTVFYVNTAILNDHMLRYPHLTHIQLNHGDSDKIASYSPVFRAYDRDFVAGQAAIDRFAAAGLATAPGFFTIVGRPQVASVTAARGPVGSLGSPCVLYAPTWSGNTQDSNYTSLPQGAVIVQALLDRGCTVVFRPHPYWDKNHHTAAGREAVVDLLVRDAAATGREHVYGPVAESELSVFDCFNLSDFMVSDVSSVVNDYLFSLKPLVMMAVTTGPEQFAEEFPVARGAYVVDYATLQPDSVGPPSATLAAALDAVCGGDPLECVRRELETYYLGDIPRDRYVERFYEEAGRFV